MNQAVKVLAIGLFSVLVTPFTSSAQVVIGGSGGGWSDTVKDIEAIGDVPDFNRSIECNSGDSYEVEDVVKGETVKFEYVCDRHGNWDRSDSKPRSRK